MFDIYNHVWTDFDWVCFFSDKREEFCAVYITYDRDCVYIYIYICALFHAYIYVRISFVIWWLLVGYSFTRRARSVLKSVFNLWPSLIVPKWPCARRRQDFQTQILAFFVAAVVVGFQTQILTFLLLLYFGLLLLFNLYLFLERFCSFDIFYYWSSL